MYDRLSQRLIGARVRVARDAQKWTQDQLSDALGFNDRQSVSDIEDGKRALRPDELVRLTDVLDPVFRTSICTFIRMVLRMTSKMRR